MARATRHWGQKSKGNSEKMSDGRAEGGGGPVIRARKAAVAAGAEWALGRAAEWTQERRAQRRVWALNGQCPITGAT